jgi:hypothetical protein
MFRVFPANLQTFIDTPNRVLEDRVQYSTVHIPNVCYNGHLKIINYVGDCSNTLSFLSHPRGAQRPFNHPVYMVFIYLLLFLALQPSAGYGLLVI